MKNCTILLGLAHFSFSFSLGQPTGHFPVPAPLHAHAAPLLPCCSTRRRRTRGLSSAGVPLLRSHAFGPPLLIHLACGEPGPLPFTPRCRDYLKTDRSPPCPRPLDPPPIARLTGREAARRALWPLVHAPSPARHHIWSHHFRRSMSFITSGAHCQPPSAALRPRMLSPSRSAAFTPPRCSGELPSPSPCWVDSPTVGCALGEKPLGGASTGEPPRATPVPTPEAR
jgi:hypothetical protein